MNLHTFKYVVPDTATRRQSMTNHENQNMNTTLLYKINSLHTKMSSLHHCHVMV